VGLMRLLPGSTAFLCTAALAMLAAGCQPPPPPALTQFALPNGDVEAGKALFLSYDCHSCHTISGLELPEPAVQGPVNIRLGGRVGKVKTYPELIMSIINPSHRLVRRVPREEVARDGESLMTVYNDVLTVAELVNIVAFLESRYEEFERPGYRYPTYSMSE
jgi:mono/diheme cytochrome c family protein